MLEADHYGDYERISDPELSELYKDYKDCNGRVDDLFDITNFLWEVKLKDASTYAAAYAANSTANSV
ncbi:hypothetical protein M569_06506 [Genlisea aurea]|uniref:Uncharacterized protein n=1 Tax=Genlisea aurea TaxID=192259 RepID=S8CNG5_9LAMI|nr:hypothetical protein M569_06506 [Genlisea aurea]